jgi:threonine synthase
MNDPSAPTAIAPPALPAVVPLSPEAFAEAIGGRPPASSSVVLRYRDALRLERDDGDDDRLKSLLERTSIREGLQVVPLFAYRDVEVDVLDETSLMHTGTMKSIDGCVTSAQCLLRGHRSVVFESGGNTGTALSVYAARAGIETFFFVPAENLPLLSGGAFESPGARVIAVDDPRQVKPAAAAFATGRQLPRVPELAWRIQASSFVGCFLLEHFLEHAPYDVLAQSISAAFGPIGIYRILRAHSERLGGLPSFLGVQQAANCPMVRAWRAGATAVPATPIGSTGRLLARVMYDGEPATYGTLEPLREILVETGGDLATVDESEFRRGLSTAVDGSNVLDHLADRGIDIARGGGEVVEKAGLMALAGTIRAIESGRIAPGSRALVCLTGGTARPGGRVDALRWGGPTALDGPHG